MNLRINKRRRIFFNVLTGFVLITALALAFPAATYHVFLFFLYSDSVERLSPEADIITEYLTFDTREKDEFEMSHLKNAYWVGYSDFSIRLVEQFPKDTAIMVYCSVGYRSEKVGKQLMKAGFSNIKNLYGGIFEWKNEGFPVYRNAAETDSIHTFARGWGFFLRNGKGLLPHSL